MIGFLKSGLLLAMLLVLTLSVLAQEPGNSSAFRFRKHQVDEGLSENSVFCILQDTKGYLWFGTKDGLNRFDGKQYRVFRPGRPLPDAPGNGFIRSITQLGSDSLWLGTDAGAYIMDITSEKFSFFNTATDSGKSITSAVHSILADRHGRTWFATNKEGLFVLDANGRLKQFPVGSQVDCIPSYTVWQVFEDQIGTIWIGTREGLLRLDETDGTFILQGDAGITHIGDDEIMSMAEDSDGTLWVGTWSGGLKKLNRSTKQYTSYFGRGNTPYITHIRALYNYSSRELLIGSDDGLYLFDRESEKIRRMDEVGIPHSLSDQNVYCIFRDREEGLWIGTYFGGANYLVNEHSGIELYSRDFSSNSLSGNAVRQFCEDPDGNLWIATEDGGVSHFDVRSRAFRRNTLPVEVSYHNVHALMFVGPQLWIGTFSRGIDIFDFRTGAMRHYRHDEADPSSLNDNCVFAMYRSRSGEIWIGTPAGLNRFNQRNNSFESIEQTRGDFVYDIMEDAYGNLWLATYGNGIIRYDTQTQRWHRYDTSDGRSMINHNKIISIHIDRLGRLWFSTEGGGIALYDYGKDSFTCYAEADGLPNNVIYGILDDDQGRLWLSSNRGITCFDTEAVKVLNHYTQADGLQSNEFNYKACYKSADGRFYFGGINGFNILDPDKLRQNTHKPKVEITGFTLLDKEPSDGEDRTMDLIRHGQDIVLAHDRSSFTISFVALSFRAPAKNLYSYRLKGGDDTWHETGNMNSVTYVDLAPGQYTFHVKASNNDGIWSSEGAVINIKVRQPWWGTLTAKICYALTLLALGYFIVRYYINRGKKLTTQRIARYKAAQEKENFVSKINFFTSIAHEIRTPLSLIKAPLEEVVCSGRWDNRTVDNLNIIERNTERLMELINQLLDFRKLETANYPIRMERMNIVDFLNGLISDFDKTARLRGINITYSTGELTSAWIVSDRQALSKVVGNLMSNALKFTTGRIEASIGQAPDGMYVITVADDGRGVPGRFKEKIFEPFFQMEHSGRGTGIGLSLAKLMAEKLGGNLTIEDNPQGGAIFVFSFRSSTSPQEIAERDASNTIKEGPSLPEANEQRAVLFVDDNGELREFIQNNLGREYNITTAEDGADALAKMGEKTFDMIITDIMMPGIDGFSLVRQIKDNTEFCHIPVILLSAKSATIFKVEGLELGAEAFIEKPFSTSFLKAQMETLLANRGRLFEMFSKAPVSMYGMLTPNKRDIEFISKLNSEIENHLSDTEFSLDILAQSFNMSRSNLQRKLKGVCGMTPNDYLQTYRLKKAAELLAGKKYRINEVCYLVGFSSASYFSKCFAKQFGVLPRDLT